MIERLFFMMNHLNLGKGNLNLIYNNLLPIMIYSTTFTRIAKQKKSACNDPNKSRARQNHTKQFAWGWKNHPSFRAFNLSIKSQYSWHLLQPFPINPHTNTLCWHDTVQLIEPKRSIATSVHGRESMLVFGSDLFTGN